MSCFLPAPLCHGFATVRAKELELYLSSTAFDFVYVPWGKKNASNVGYAFVNFVDSSHLAEARRLMEGKQWQTGSRSRVVEVSVARVQGLSQNLNHFFEQRESIDDKHLPLVFMSGAPIELSQAATWPQLGVYGGRSPTRRLLEHPRRRAGLSDPGQVFFVLAPLCALRFGGHVLIWSSSSRRLCVPRNSRADSGL